MHTPLLCTYGSPCHICTYRSFTSTYCPTLHGTFEGKGLLNQLLIVIVKPLLPLLRSGDIVGFLQSCILGNSTLDFFKSLVLPYPVGCNIDRCIISLNCDSVIKCDPVCRNGSYSLSNCTYLAMHNLNCE